MKISKICPQCGNEHSVEVQLCDYIKYQSGKYLIQECFPYLTPAEREIIITGICDECFNKLFLQDIETDN